MKRKILVIFLLVIMITLTNCWTNYKVQASTSCTADEAIAKITVGEKRQEELNNALHLFVNMQI